jgi:hypothetical protein
MQHGRSRNIGRNGIDGGMAAAVFDLAERLRNFDGIERAASHLLNVTFATLTQLDEHGVVGDSYEYRIQRHSG